MVGIPRLLSFPEPWPFGINRWRTGNGRNVPPLTRARRSFRNPGTPTVCSTASTVAPSTPGVFRPLFPATRPNATSSVAGVVHEIEQVIKPAAGIGHRPTVKLGLHSRYPGPRMTTSKGRTTRVHGWIFRHHSVLTFSFPLPPFPMRRALPGSEYYGG